MQAVIHEWNALAVLFFAQLINTLLPSLAAVFIAALITGRKAWNAATRYCVSWSLLLLTVLLPVVLCFAPAKHRPIITVPQAITSVSDLEVTQITASVPSRRILREPAGFPVTPSLASLALFVWLAASGVQCLRIAVSLCAAARMKRQATDLHDEQARTAFKLTELLPAGRRVRFAASHNLKSPAAIGYFRPAILLPQELLKQLTPDELKQILLHELAHIRRFDDYGILLQRMIEAVAVFHPLVRYLSHVIHLQRELCADDQVTAYFRPQEYAGCLTKLAGKQHEPVGLSTSPAFHCGKAELLLRVEWMFDAAREHAPFLLKTRLLTALAALVLIACGALRLPRLMAYPAPQNLASDQYNIYMMAVTLDRETSAMFGAWSGWSYGMSGQDPRSIVFKTDNKTFIIRDGATFKKAEDLVGPLQDLSRIRSQVDDQQEQLRQAERELDQQQSTLADFKIDSELHQRLSKQTAALEQQMHKLAAQSPAAVREAQTELADAQLQLADVQAQMDSAQQELAESQHELATERTNLGRQQVSVFLRQHELNLQTYADNRRIGSQLKQIIHAAQMQGLAQQIP